MLDYKTRKQFLTTYTCILLFAVVGFFVRQGKFDEIDATLQVQLMIVSIILIIILWESLRGIHSWLNRKYPFERNIPGRIFLQLVLGACLGVFIRFVLYQWGEPRLPFALDSLFIAATWVLYIVVPSVVNLGFFTVYFIERWKDSIVFTERLQKEKVHVQFDNLKNQMNPHFLFNALTSLNSLIFENQQLASEFVQHLSKVYRYVLQHKDRNFVLLSTELEFISNYVKLLETRFRGALRITFEVGAEAREKAIVPVTLQILIENAVKHNIADVSKPLVVEVVSVGDYLIVSNNLQPKKSVETSNRLGLENLKSLYRFLTDKPVLVEPTEERFYVKIPLI